MEGKEDGILRLAGKYGLKGVNISERRRRRLLRVFVGHGGFLGKEIRRGKCSERMRVSGTAGLSGEGRRVYARYEEFEQLFFLLQIHDNIMQHNTNRNIRKYNSL